MTSKAKHSSVSSAASLINIHDLNQLPFIRPTRQLERESLFISCVKAIVGLLLILLTATVIYLTVSLCLVQQQLTIVQQELTDVGNRLHAFEKHHLQKDDFTTTDVNRIQNPSGTQGQPDNRGSNDSSIDSPLTSEEEHETKEDHRITQRDASPSKQRSERRQNDSKPKSVKIKDLEKQIKALKQDLSHPSAHVFLPQTRSSGSTASIMTYTQKMPNNVSVIQWAKEPNSLFETNDSVKFHVKAPGTYFIYAQVTFTGQEGRGNPSCSYIVVLDNPNEPTRKMQPLLYASVTQFELGEVLFTNDRGDELRATDSLHASGLFRLIPGDRLFVQIDQYSTKCTISHFKDRTFFGAFRLQPFFYSHT